MGPIAASAPGTSLTTAKGNDLTINTLCPFHKLDSTKDISFQIITLFFSQEPPDPDGVTTFYTRTPIYSFPHGYNYTPSTWFLISLDNFQTAFGSEGAFLVGGGTSNPFNSSAVLVITVDDTNVNFYLDKFYIYVDPILSRPPSVLGIFAAVRSYIFVNDLLGLDVPTHP